MSKIILLSALLLVLIIRFVLPELFYAVRHRLLLILSKRAFLLHKESDGKSSSYFKQALLVDTQIEPPAIDSKSVLRRLSKIKKLYRLLDPARHDENSTSPRGAQACIVEVAELIAKLAREVRPRQEYAQPVVRSGGILAFIANEVRRSRGEPNLTAKGQEVEKWLMANPLNIEQAVELLLATAYGLVYRQAADEGTKWELDGDEDPLSSIVELERSLRMTVRLHYQRKYRSDFEVHQRMQMVLKEPIYSEIIRRMQRVRSESRDLTLEFVDFVDLSQISVLIEGEWDGFSGTLKDMDWLSQELRKLSEIRAFARVRPITEMERRQVLDVCREIESRLSSGLVSLAS